MGSGTDGTSYGTDSDGNPKVFNLERNGDGVWLNNNWTKPDNQWNLDNEVLLRRRKFFFSVTVTRRGFSLWDFPSSSAIRQASCLPLPASQSVLHIDHGK